MQKLQLNNQSHQLITLIISYIKEQKEVISLCLKLGRLGKIKAMPLLEERETLLSRIYYIAEKNGIEREWLKIKILELNNFICVCKKEL